MPNGQMLHALRTPMLRTSDKCLIVLIWLAESPRSASDSSSSCLPMTRANGPGPGCQWQVPGPSGLAPPMNEAAQHRAACALLHFTARCCLALYVCSAVHLHLLQCNCIAPALSSVRKASTPPYGSPFCPLGKMPWPFKIS